MQEFEFCISPSAPLSDADRLIESLCVEQGLQIGMKGTLARFPGSIHWHFKKHGERGTLEITSFPKGKRIWAQIQSGRRADWIEPCITTITAKLEKALGTSKPHAL